MNIAKQRHANRTSSTSNSSDGDEPTRDLQGVCGGVPSRGAHGHVLPGAEV
jgi:hypothetical protein